MLLITNINDGSVLFSGVTLKQCDNVHNTRTLKLTQPKEVQLSLILIFTDFPTVASQKSFVKKTHCVCPVSYYNTQMEQSHR